MTFMKVSRQEQYKKQFASKAFSTLVMTRNVKDQSLRKATGGYDCRSRRISSLCFSANKVYPVLKLQISTVPSLNGCFAISVT